MKITAYILIISIAAGISFAHAANKSELINYEREYENAYRAFDAKNYEKAFVHLQKASKLGHKHAQYLLSLLYMEGKGTQQDFAQAYIWLNVASEAKVKDWRKMSDTVKSALSTKQIASLNPYVDQFIARYGATAQEIVCDRVKQSIGVTKKMICFKRMDSKPMLDTISPVVPELSRPKMRSGY